MAKIFDFLKEKFKQSQDYKYEFLLRDLRDFAEEVGDRFEYGTWTPEIKFGGASVGLTYASQFGIWAKSGRLFHLGFSMTLSAKGTSVGSAQIYNAPYFGVDNAAGVATGVFTGLTSWAGLTSTPYLLLGLGPGGPMRQINATGQVDLTDANFTNTSFMRGKISGIAAS